MGFKHRWYGKSINSSSIQDVQVKGQVFSSKDTSIDSIFKPNYQNEIVKEIQARGNVDYSIDSETSILASESTPTLIHKLDPAPQKLVIHKNN